MTPFVGSFVVSRLKAAPSESHTTRRGRQEGELRPPTRERGHGVCVKPSRYFSSSKKPTPAVGVILVDVLFVGRSMRAEENEPKKRGESSSATMAQQLVVWGSKLSERSEHRGAREEKGTDSSSDSPLNLKLR